MTAIYETRGQLTNGGIEPENVAKAQAYLTNDHNGKPLNMQQYLDPSLEAVILLRWFLDGNGLDYRVEAICSRELNDDELKALASEISGQNSDGLGEGFEQQDFAWNEEGHDCDSDCDECDGYGCEDGGVMVSFDWKTNDSTLTRIA